MDKQTLSQYGWVVICVLVLAVMIGMATPFGNAIKGSVNDTVGVMDGGASSALDDAFDGEEDGTDEVTMLDGDGQTNNKVFSKDLTFRSSAPINTFQEVRVDGQTVDSSNYTVTEGSTIVTLNKEYLASLSVNKHTLDIVSTVGTATADFSVVYIAGLYDESGNMTMTWDEIVTTYPGAFTESGKIVYDYDFAIDRAQFTGCLVIDNSISTIGASAFMDFDSLTSIVIPDSVICIEGEAFMDCSSLTNISLPNGVYLDVAAFDYCSSLTNVTIPNNIEFSQYGMFNYCTSLKTVNFAGTCEQFYNLFCTDTGFYEISFKNCSGIICKCSDGAFEL